jgi:hypothetical protein
MSNKITSTGKTTYVAKVTSSDQTTFVKTVKIGIPIQSVNIDAGDINALSNVDAVNAKHYNILVYDSDVSKWVNADSANLVNLTLTGNVKSNLVPSQDSSFDLGDSDFKWKDLYLSGGTLHLGGLDIKDSSTGLSVTDSVGNPVNFSLLGSRSQIRGFFGAGGDLSYDPSTGIFQFDVEQVYTRANFESDLGAAIAGGTGITYDSSTDTISITNTGVTAATYGSASEVPQITVNDQGQITSATNVNIAGVTGVTFDSSNGALTVSTSAGTSFTDSINLNPFTTTNLTEGDNLYYTTARADSAARHSVSAAGDLSYDPNTGIFQFDVEQVYTKANFESDLGDAISGGTGITYDSSTDTISITNTNVTAGTYGSASEIPSLKINAQGQVDSAGTVTVAGVTSTSFDSASQNFTITTADGGTFVKMISNRMPSASAGAYGSASNVPIVTVNQYGLVDSIGTTSVAGVSSTVIDSSTGDFTINTADGGVFKTRLYDANILNNDGNKAGITWTVSGSTDQFRTATNYIDSDLEVYTIREMNFTGNKLRIEVAQFSPGLTATGQTNLNFDQKATQFSVAIDNPSDFTTRFISSVSGIAQTDAYVGTVLGNYNAGSKSATPAGGIDWTQTFTFDSASGAAVRDNSTTIVGGTSIGEITFADDQGANFGTTASFSTTWKTPNVSISMSNLSGNQFLETYSSTSYTVNVTNMSSSSNVTHTVTPTGGSVNNTSGSGTFTFTTPIHKDNGGGRTLALSTVLLRPAGVATTTYSVVDTDADTSLNANFSYPSLTIFTAGSGTPPTRGDVVNNDQFESAVTELSHQTKTFSQTVNNSDSVPKCFWFMVRSAASQPTTFQTGASSSLLSDVSTTTGTLDLEPDSPPGGYTAETYNLYGIILQPGNTFVSIS